MATKTKSPTEEAVNVNALPILPLRNSVLFPGLVMPLVIGREKTLRLLDAVAGKDEVIGVLTQRDKETQDPNPGDMYTTGTTARILPDFGHTLMLEPGWERAAQAIAQVLQPAAQAA